MSQLPLTRISTQELQKAVSEAAQKIFEATQIMSPYLRILTDDERARTPKPSNIFPEAARSLCRAMEAQPKVAAMTDFDSTAVCEDLDNVSVLAPLLEQLTELSLQASDSRLVWMAEAYLPCLAVYAVAKAGARTNASLRTVTEPLARIFATGGRPRSEEI